MVHPASLEADELLNDCDIEKTRRGGPGGQHRNKVETAILIHHRPSGVSGQASERRSQQANRVEAIKRLRLNLAVGIRCPAGRNAPPSPLWRARIRQGRISANSAHDDFPALLAEALDQVAACRFEMPIAAKKLQVSGSQLLKFLKKFPPAILWVNQQREQLGMGKLK